MQTGNLGPMPDAHRPRGLTGPLAAALRAPEKGSRYPEPSLRQAKPGDRLAFGRVPDLASRIKALATAAEIDFFEVEKPASTTPEEALFDQVYEAFSARQTARAMDLAAWRIQLELELTIRRQRSENLWNRHMKGVRAEELRREQEQELALASLAGTDMAVARKRRTGVVPDRSASGPISGSAAPQAPATDSN
ncbi:MAG: hypothetical protein VKO64_08340 [Candidatus Sericytochromatia bacterium]|nr:hypothetical protein [Candidatus Sericytochromatia bacterium]